MDEDRETFVPPQEGGEGPQAGETPTSDEAAASRDGEAPQSEEERVKAVIDELRRLKVEDLALDMAVSLVTVGYQKLGLTDQTRELRDLAGARLAIELLRASLDVLEREGAAVTLGDLRSTLAAMQLNYARAAAETPPAAAAVTGVEEPPPAEDGSQAPAEPPAEETPPG